MEDKKPFEVNGLKNEFLQKLDNSFHEDVFICFWELSFKITLHWFKWRIDLTNVASQEIINMSIVNNFDIRSIYLETFYQRAHFILKYINQIIDNEKVISYIFNNTAMLNQATSFNSLLKLWYLDITFCKNNVGKLHNYDKDVRNHIIELFKKYENEVEHMTSLQWKTEVEKHEEIFKTHLFLNKFNLFDSIENYYINLDDLFIKK